MRHLLATLLGAVVWLFLLPAGSSGGIPAKLTLKRVFPASNELGHLQAMDRIRHGRLLKGLSSSISKATTSPNASVIDFPVDGSSNPFSIGFYYTSVKLGNPPVEFYVQIDTGSDILWVSCDSCSGCPKSSGLIKQLEFFNPQQSSSASTISCSDEQCSSAIRTADSSCSTSSSDNSLCSYSFQYGDGSGSSGYYVSDTLHFESVTGNEQSANSSASVIFGCSNSLTGDLTKSDRAVDGIFGFGQSSLSVISQLSNAGVAPKVFSHCLKGSENGGGILVLGEIVEPGIVYTPLVQSQPHYNLNLQSIAVGGQILSIDSSVFATSSTQGTIIDSGTTLAYLADAAYDPFVNAVATSISRSVQSTVSNGNQCFVTSSSVNQIFPTVTLNFEGNASMVLRPQDYLLQQGSIDDAVIWCIGWQKNTGQGMTILGDLVLKDKIVIYDLANQRIGWVNYDCSLPVNVSTPSNKSSFVNTGQLSQSGSSRSAIYNSLLLKFTIFFVQTLFTILML